MPDFTSSQTQLGAARAALDQAQLSALQASERARQAQSALDVATRQQNPNDPANLAQLTAAANQASAASDAARNSLAQSRTALTAATVQFAGFSDPRQAVSQLSDSSPFLLVPVRIETRFRTVPPKGRPGIAVAAPQHQLWIRIYPDDCSIDTFEPMLSSAELTNVKNYSMNMWRAGGVENDQRGAWSNLVAAHGSGRAGWLADNFQPTNLSAEPAKTNASDEILVIPTATPLIAAEASAITVYWQAYWLADGDAAKQQAAADVLNAAVGAARAAELIANYVPFNLNDAPAPPLTKAGVGLSTSFVIFPPDPVTTLQSWSQAPQVRQFPDRFMVLGFNGGTQTLEAVGAPVTLPLYTGPDPTADPTAGIHPNGPDLFVPPELQWMVDFDTAVAAGMALAIDLTPAQATAGFDRLLVLGLQLSTPENLGSAAVQELLAHHQASRSGFELIAQGTPAHNTTGADSGYTKGDDPDTSFDDRKNRPLFTVVSDLNQKQDGQWLAEFLGIDPAFVATVHGSGGIDQKQARAMQRAMWPATLGYWMNTLFTPNPGKASIFSDAVIEETRSFFSQCVSGRGALPAIRIGGQPYGILPVTAFSRVQWFNERRPVPEGVNSQQFLGTLYNILRQLDGDWATMSQNASWVGSAGDAHQTLLNVLAHYPSSVEYYSRTAESASQLFNMLNFWALAPDWWQAILALLLQAQAIALLGRLRYSGTDLPDLLNHFFLTDSPQITTVIDDQPLSETNPIRSYTDDGRNYIQWMIDAASTSMDTLRAETGFSSGKSPQALLYLYLRHALLIGYYDSSYNYHRDTGILTPPALLGMRTEPPFIHIADAPGSSESRFAALYKTESRITGSPSELVSDFIRLQIGISSQTAGLADQLDALKILETGSTAELERLFAEHIDTCSYRYDSWLLGLVSQYVANLRASAPAQNGQQGGGLYLGAYAWVEDLRPSAQATPAQIPPALAAQFPGPEPLMNDPAGGGYIHAPSIPHADTAAVLRSGYLANRSSATPDTLAVNLSSDRVRVALSLIEGIRNGQSLGALLGYQFELGLHDDYGLAEVDKFIYPLRKAFPLVADAMTSTKTDSTVPIEAIEARNVLDGKKLMDQVQKSGVSAYPYGLTTLPAASSAEQTAIDAETQALLDAYDAIADLALAEGVHQAVQGNYDRVASTIEAYTTGNFPPEPAVIQTPPSGIGLTHRFALHLKPGLTAPAGATSRAQAEPAIDDWLGSMLPPLGNIGCTVIWNDPVTGTPQTQVVTLADLGLRPLDVLFLLKPDNVQAMAELDDRITSFTIATWNPRPDAAIQIQYMTGAAGQFSMFETGPLLRSLRTLITQSRALLATDASRSNDATADDNSTVFADKARISAPLADLQAVSTDMASFLSTLAPLVADPVAKLTQIIAGVDTNLASAIALLERASRFNVPASGWGFAHSWLQSAFADLLAQVSALVTRWNQKLTDFQNALNAYDVLPAGTSDADRFAALQAAELLLSSELDPLPPTPAMLRGALPAKGTAFQARLNQFAAILTTADPSFANLLTAATALSTSEFDSQPFDVSAFGQRAVIVTQDIVRVLTAQSSAINTRTAAVQQQLTICNSSSSAADQVKALQTAAKALFGADFQFVPEFTVSAAQGGEWANAYNASLTGNLLTYLKTTLNIDFPVDEWMYGAARVRPVLRTWESAVMLATAFGLTPVVPTPVQLPYEAGASWIALPYPSSYTIDSDRLLYTALYPAPFDASAHQCGLLLDEWTEVIPADTRDTAVTFQYTRPDNEPPQTMLLVTAAANTGTWQWADLVDALNETLDLAKKRAVEPAFLDPTVYSRFLPATVMASTSYAITIATPITAATGAIDILQGGAHA